MNRATAPPGVRRRQQPGMEHRTPEPKQLATAATAPRAPPLLGTERLLWPTRAVMARTAEEAPLKAARTGATGRTKSCTDCRGPGCLSAKLWSSHGCASCRRPRTSWLKQTYNDTCRSRCKTVESLDLGCVVAGVCGEQITKWTPSIYFCQGVERVLGTFGVFCLGSKVENGLPLHTSSSRRKRRVELRSMAVDRSPAEFHPATRTFWSSRAGCC